VHPAQRERVDTRAELGEHGREQRERREETKTTLSMIPSAIERNAGLGTSITAEAR
jgi:hypothetical protein